MTTDFEGEWYLEYDALSSLQEVLHQWHTKQAPWWTLRSEKLINVVHYPVTASQDEWSDELLRLDQLVVEGFEKKWLKRTAEAKGRKPDPNFGSLKLIEECLLSLGFEPADAVGVVAPLKDLHDLRSKMKGHASGGEAVAIRKKLLKEHGTLAAHFRELCRKCDESIRVMDTSLGN